MVLSDSRQSAPRAQTIARILPRILLVPVLALAGTAAFLFFPFSAEDSFITYRYAENLVRLGSLVFNAGEPVMALTSPLHGLLSTFLFVLSGDTVLSNKIVGGVLLAAAALLVWSRYDDRPLLQPIVAALILLPPSMVLWAFGGLETPLLLFLVTAATVLAGKATSFGRSQVCLLFFLAGLAFLARYDSALFMAPLLLFVMVRARSVRDLAIGAIVGSVLPLAWLAVSLAFYGDLFPTSYYAKTPGYSVPVVLWNGRYVLTYLFLVGLAPTLLLALTLLRRWPTMLLVVTTHITTMWWLYLGITAQLLYGLTMAQTHMMFSFRYFVPYIPALTIIVVDLFGSAMNARRLSESRRSWATSLLVLALLLVQGVQVGYTYTTSVNGYYPRGEYPYAGVRQYTTFIETLRAEGENIRTHWSGMRAASSRAPRVYTYAGGVLPHTLPEAYIYETLVSYRHCTDERSLIQAPNVWMKTNVDLRLAADYIHVITPRHGEIGPQLPLPEDQFSLISSFEIDFDGAPERFLVFFNPTPGPHQLTSTINGLCTEVNGSSLAERRGHYRTQQPIAQRP